MFKSFATLLVAGTIFFAVQGLAEENIKIGFVDIQEVFSNYDKAAEQEAEFMKEAQTELDKVRESQKEIEKMRDEIEQQQHVMTPEQKRQKDLELFQKFEEYRKKAEQIRQEVEIKGQAIEAVLLTEIRKAINEYAANAGFSLVLDSRLVLYGIEGLDITPEIIEKINQR